VLTGHPLFHHEDVERPAFHAREYCVPPMRYGDDGPPGVSQNADSDVAEVVVVADEENWSHCGVPAATASGVPPRFLVIRRDGVNWTVAFLPSDHGKRACLDCFSDADG
jgi:hypothetical protein